MNDESKMENLEEQHDAAPAGKQLPHFNQLPSVKPAAARHVVEIIIGRDDVATAIHPFFTREMCGHKMMDMKAVVDIVKEADRKHLRYSLQPFKLTDFQLCNLVKSVMRTRYVLNKRWKIDAIQPKVAAKLAEKVEA